LVVNRGLHIREVENAIKNGLIEAFPTKESQRVAESSLQWER
jgi:hypothetical protein